MPIHRDKETGQVITNGSKIGGVLEWTRWLSQVILIPFMVFVFWWAASVQKFIWAGDRQTAAMSDAQHVAMEERWELRFQGLPPEWFVALQDEKFDNVEQQISELKAQQAAQHAAVMSRIDRLEEALREIARER